MALTDRRWMKHVRKRREMIRPLKAGTAIHRPDVRRNLNEVMLEDRNSIQKPALMRLILPFRATLWWQVIWLRGFQDSRIRQTRGKKGSCHAVVTDMGSRKQVKASVQMHSICQVGCTGMRQSLGPSDRLSVRAFDRSSHLSGITLVWRALGLKFEGL